jgi:enoyl-CoA hydratase/carnithine racemase
MTSDSTCLYEVNDHIATITMNRPHRFNAMNLVSYQETTDAFKRADADPEVRCVVFTGAGRGFCSGDDVQELMGGDGLEGMREGGGLKIEIPGPVMQRMDCPVIAAVNGAAVGYGFEMALLADIRVASEKARFSQMFVRRGLVAGAPSYALLTQLTGPAHAAEILLTGEMISAERALELGVVSQVVEHDSLLDEARALAAKIAANPPLAVRRGKRALQLARTGKTAELDKHARDALAELIRTNDHKESVAAYLEKREASFTGT